MAQTQENWKEDMRRIVKEVLKEELSPLFSKENDTEKGHQTPEEMANCPNCYPKIEPIVTPKVLKKYAEYLKGKKLAVCKECGLVVRETEQKCPNCGGKEASYF